jgi:hypothetical protein
MIAKSYGWHQVKVGHSGWPDHLYLGPRGLTLWVEFKTPTGRLSPRQAARIDTLRWMGHWVEVIKDQKSFADCLHNALNPCKMLPPTEETGDEQDRGVAG